MKKLISIVLATAALLAGTNAYAQFSAGVGWLNSTEITRYTNKDNVDRDNLNGFYVGGQYNLEMFENFGVAPGLYFSSVFGKYANSKGIKAGSNTTRADYREIMLNLPVNINYSIPVGGDVNIIVYAGPVFQLGLVSRSSIENRTDTIFGSATTGRWTYNYYTGKWKDPDGKTYDDDASRNRFNMFLGGGVGVQLGDFQILFGYDHSMLDFSKIKEEKASRSQFKLGIGISF